MGGEVGGEAYFSLTNIVAIQLSKTSVIIITSTIHVDLSAIAADRVTISGSGNVVRIACYWTPLICLWKLKRNELLACTVSPSLGYLLRSSEYISISDALNSL